MLVTLAVSSVLVAVAVPGFVSMVRSTRVNNAYEALANTIQLTRSEAIRTGQQMNIDQINCALADWGCGWTVYPDLNLDGQQNLPAEPAFRTVLVPPAVRITKNNNPAQYQVSRFGQAVGVVNTTFRVGPREDANFSDCRSMAVGLGMRLTPARGSTACPAPSSP